MIAHDRKVIFIHIPKTAGESISCFLTGQKDQALKHAKAPIIQKMFPKEWDAYYKFSFVRNPWDLAVSFYAHLRKPLDPYYIKNPQELYGGQKILNPVYLGEFALNHSFKEFIIEVYENEGHKKCVGFFDPYLSYLCDEAGKLAVDFIGKYENLQQDFKLVCERLGIKEGKLLQLNSSKHKPYESYYDRDTEAIVSRYYKNEIEMFGYKFKA